MDTQPTKVELMKRLENAKSLTDKQKEGITILQTENRSLKAENRSLKAENNSLQQQKRQQQERLQDLERECAAKDTKLRELRAEYDAKEQHHKKNGAQPGQPCQNAECKKEKEELWVTLHRIQSKPCERTACADAARRLKDIELYKNRPGECTLSGCTVAKRELERVTQELKDMEKKLAQPCQRSECQETKRELSRLSSKSNRKCEREECVTNEQELYSLKQQVRQLSSKSNRKCEREECVTNEQELYSLKQQVRQKQQEYSQARQELQRLNQDIERKQQEYRQALQRGKHENERKQQECSQARQELQRLNQDIERKQQEYRQALQRAKQEIERKQQECSQARQECSQARQDIQREQQECNQARQQLQRVKQEIERQRQLQCQRQECSQTRQDLLRADQEILRMQSQPCNSKQCQNAQLALLNTRVGPPIEESDGNEIPLTTMMVKLYKKIEENQKIFQQESHELELQNELDQARSKIADLLKEPCTNKGCGQIREGLQRRVKELQNAFSAPKCTRPDCQKLQKQLREKELQIIGKVSPGDDMEKQRGGDHDELIEEFEYLTTDPDGILRVLEGILGQFEAKRLLSVLFQRAYDKCRKKVLHTLIQGLLSGLFSVLTSTPEMQGTWDLEGASRGFGLLLHAFALKTENMKTEACVAISQEICNDFKGDPSFSNVQSALQSGCADWLGRVVQLTWRFTTLPTPLIMCQPDKFHDQIHEPQFGHWDKRKQKTNDYTLVYLRPVVYRSYHGKRACKGWVAMEGVHEEVEKKAKAGTRTQSGGKDQGGSWWPPWSR